MTSAEGRSRSTDQDDAENVVRQPGACADPSCPVLHADSADPIHPPFYEPGGPFIDVPKWLKVADECADCGAHVEPHEVCDCQETDR